MYSSLAQLIKNLPVMQETWVRSLDWEDPLEKGKATHSSIFAWKILWREEPCRLHHGISYDDWGLQHDFTYVIYILCGILGHVINLNIVYIFLKVLDVLIHFVTA